MFHIILFVMLIFIISFLVMMISILLGTKTLMDREKPSPFECGFDINSKSRLPFSLRFFLITIIFLIFDVEIVLLLPAIKSFPYTSFHEWNLMYFTFIIILLGGLFHEWKEGALNWSI